MTVAKLFKPKTVRQRIKTFKQDPYSDKLNKLTEVTLDEIIPLLEENVEDLDFYSGREY